MIDFIKKLFSKKEEDCSFRSQGIVVEKRLLESRYIGAMQFDRENTAQVPFNLLSDLAINYVRSRVTDYYFECVKLLSSIAIKDLSLIHISEPTRRLRGSRMPSSA